MPEMLDTQQKYGSIAFAPGTHCARMLRQAIELRNILTYSQSHVYRPAK